MAFNININNIINKPKHWQTIPPKLSLLTDNIIILLIPLSDDHNLIQHCYHILNTEEKNRADRLIIIKKRFQFIILRAYLRFLLANAIDCKTEHITLLNNKYNKPYTKLCYQSHHIEFNIAHSQDYGLIGISLDDAIGVDIEYMNDDIDYQTISKRFFSTQEYQSILKKEQQLDAFYTCWVRKEAFSKATGKGIIYGFQSFSISIDKECNQQTIQDKKQREVHITHINMGDQLKYQAAYANYGKKKTSSLYYLPINYIFKQ